MRGNKIAKIFDVVIGIPIVFLLGIFKKKKNFNKKCLKKIGILHTAPIGDTVLCSAVIKDLKKKYSDAEIYLFIGKDGLQTAKLFLDCTVNCINITKFIKTIKDINNLGEFDLWIDFGPWPRINSIISHFIKASFKIGFKSRNQFRHYIYDKCVIHSDIIHELCNYRNLVKLVDVDSTATPEINIKGGVIDDLIVVHMFPGGYKSHFKKWPEENWIELIRWLLSKQYNVFITGAPSDKDDAVKLSKTFGDEKKLQNVIGMYNLSETANLICKSRLVITVNTGIMHLASSLKKDLIAIHGPTSIKRWGPVCDNAVSIKPDISCSPCLHLGFEYGCRSPKCMGSVTAEDVKVLIDFKLQKNSPGIIDMKNIHIGSALNSKC